MTRNVRQMTRPGRDLAVQDHRVGGSDERPPSLTPALALFDLARAGRWRQDSEGRDRYEDIHAAKMPEDADIQASAEGGRRGYKPARDSRSLPCCCDPRSRYAQRRYAA